MVMIKIIKIAPISAAAFNQPKPMGPTFNISLANTGIMATAPPNSTANKSNDNAPKTSLVCTTNRIPSFTLSKVFCSTSCTKTETLSNQQINPIVQEESLKFNSNTNFTQNSGRVTGNFNNNHYRTYSNITGVNFKIEQSEVNGKLIFQFFYFSNFFI